MAVFGFVQARSRARGSAKRRRSDAVNATCPALCRGGQGGCRHATTVLAGWAVPSQHSLLSARAPFCAPRPARRGRRAMERGAFSGKKKKALLQAKRKTQRERQEGPDGAQAERASAQPRARPQLKTVLQREDEAEVMQGRADATRPLELTAAARDGLLMPWPDALRQPLSMPLRPPWSYADTASVLDARERAAFEAWDAALQASHGGGTLSRYERNLEVWRQLWRTMEVSDALLAIVDIRTPLLSFPAPLYEAAAAHGTPFVAVLNKADLLPPAVVDAWAAHLRERFPRLTAVVPFRADPGAAPKGFRGGGRRPTGFSRWRAADDAVRNDVELLLRTIKALPVTRHGVQRTVADFWGERDAAGGAAACAASGRCAAEAEEPAADADEHAAAAAALAQSDGWAAQQQLPAAGDASELCEHADAARQQLPYVTIGVVGEPNMGKSALINRLFRAPVVKARQLLPRERICGHAQAFACCVRAQASPTPGCTKHLQTLFLRPLVRLADCPGLIFPKADVPMGMQLLCGNTPIAQAREPFATVRYLAEAGVHPPLPAAYGLSLSDAAEHSSRVAGEWSPYALCEALAVKRSFLTRGGRPDVFRAANRVLRDALAGKNIRLAFVPPGAPACPWTPAQRAAAEDAAVAHDDAVDTSGTDDSDASSSEASSDDAACQAATTVPSRFAALDDDA
jgi:ribosome biogenesis GTPase A